MLFQSLLISLFGLSLALMAQSQNYFNECNFQTHHTHIILPVAPDRKECKADNAPFFLVHGGTFFCPHNYDVVITAEFGNSSIQSVFCDNYFDSVENGESPIYALRPTLVQNGLMMEAYNLPVFWMSDYLYHIHDFGHGYEAGPGEGEYPWNSTTVLETQIFMVNLFNIWFTEFSIVAKRPDELTYLLHAIPYQDSYVYFLTHYILNAPGFEHIINVNKIVFPPGVEIGNQRYPNRLTFHGAEDNIVDRLQPNQVYNAGLTSLVGGGSNEVQITIQTGLDNYAGFNDGFASYATNCEIPPPHAQARALCP